MDDLDKKALIQLEKDVGADMLPLIIEQFLAELLAKRLEIEQAIHKKSLSVLAESAHSLKSTARTLGMTRLADSASMVEGDARASRLTVIESGAAHQLLDLIERGHAALSAYPRSLL